MLTSNNVFPGKKHMYTHKHMYSIMIRTPLQLSQETSSLIHVGTWFTRFLPGPQSSNIDNPD